MTQSSSREPLDHLIFLDRARASESGVPRGPIRRAFAALRRQIIRLNAARETRKHYRATYWALMELDDRTLKDIGVARSDITAVALGTFADAPARNAPTPTTVPGLRHRVHPEPCLGQTIRGAVRGEPCPQ